MKKKVEKIIERDRTYRAADNSKYFTLKQYQVVAFILMLIHCFFEVFYIVISCTPMAVINLFSIVIYVISMLYMKKWQMLITVWVLVLEVYMHAIFACIFLGMNCGIQLWLFGTLASIFLPFFMPKLSKGQKIRIIAFSLVIVMTYVTLNILDDNKLLPTTYNVEDELARLMYYINVIIGFSAIILCISVYSIMMEEKNRDLQKMADHDFLTGIFNRQRIKKILDAEIKIEKESSGGLLAIAILDVDLFKNVNDTYGHEAGDDVLKEMARIFGEYGDRGLLYGRWGGEEFMLISPENISYDEFAELLQNIREEIAEHPFNSDGHTMKITVSIGAALYENGMTTEKLVHIADGRLYTAKESGRNTVIY